LAGTLDVQFANGFTPIAGNSFKVMTYGSLTGQFDTVNVTGLASGLTVTPQYDGTDLMLVISGTASGMAIIAQPMSGDSQATQTVSDVTNTSELGAEKMNPPLAFSVTELDYRFAQLAESELTTAGQDSGVLSAANQQNVDLFAKGDVSASSDEVFASLGDGVLLAAI
jgi:hypothetical protein